MMTVGYGSRWWRRSGCAAAAIACLCACSAAQVSPRLLAGLHWRNIGPFIAGRAGAVCGVIGQPAVYYVGFADGGIWKTVSAGTVWFPLTDTIKGIAGVSALAVAQSQPTTIYAGTGDAWDQEGGSGVWKSTDAGRTWENVGLHEAGEITALLVDPHNPDLILASTRGWLHRPSSQRGVYRSSDGGRTWTQVLAAGPKAGATHMVWAFDNPSVVFATVGTTYRAPGARFVFGGRSTAKLFKSTDEGTTWSQVQGTNQPPVGEIAVADGTNSQRLYMLDRGGLYRSDDGGAGWRLGTHTIYTAGTHVYVDPKNPDVVYTLGTSSYRSVDGGHTLVAFKGAPGGDDPREWWIDPHNPNRILYGGDQGATVSLDGGHTWSSWYNQPTAQVYRIRTDNRYPFWVYASKQDSGTFGVASRGPLGEVTDLDWFPLPGWEAGSVAVDPLNQNLIYTNGNYAYLSKVFRKTWDSQIIDPGVGDASQRRAANPPIVFSPQDPHVLYWATQYVWATSDGGTQWRKISPDLTAHPGRAPVPAPGVVHHGDALDSLSLSAVQAGVMWTGSTNGVIYLTRNGGRHWEDVTPPSVSIYGIVRVEASHFNPAAAYAAVDNSATGDFTPHIYRTSDWGKTWQPIISGLPTAQPTGSFVRVVREDPNKQGLLFAGTESSVYVSFDNGDHWQSLRLNLPTTSFRDLRIHSGDLVAGTYGRAIWILDDISPLEQMTPGLVEESAHLFRPQAAIRVHRDVNQDTPFPPEVPHAKNPPQGAVIDFYLGQAAQTVKLQIFDASGNLVRTYTNAPIPPVPLPYPAAPTPSFWLRRLLPLPVAAGAHRVTWNLRYQVPHALSFNYGQTMGAVPGDTPYTPQGPLAVPGHYTVKLTVDGKSYQQPLVLRPDPREGDSPALFAGMRRQLHLGQQLMTLIAASKAAYEQGRALEARAPAQRTELAKLTGTLKDAVSGPYGVLPVGGVPSFAGINGQAVGVLVMVNYHSDRAPASPLYAAYAKFCHYFNADVAQWGKLQPSSPISALACATRQ
ncbi:MAG: WD40/YVTN/BNR-like repeat-containing protein [Terriglobales bacterium]